MKKFLIKKHIRQERLQSYVNQCNFKNILSEEQQFSLGQIDDNNYQSDVSEMYFIQKSIITKRQKQLNKESQQKPQIVQPNLQLTHKTSIRPQFATAKSQENKTQQNPKQNQSPNAQNKIPSKQIIYDTKASKHNISSKAHIQQQDIAERAEEHSFEIINSNSCLDLQEILVKHQASKSQANQPLRIEDQKSITNQSNISKRNLLRLKQEEPLHNDTKQAILSQMELQEQQLSSNKISDKQHQESKIQEMYYYTSALDRIHNSSKASPTKATSAQSQLLKGSQLTPPNKIGLANESLISPNKVKQQQYQQITQLIDASYKLTLQSQKIYMFSHLIDFEMMSDTRDIYPPNGWSQYYQQQFIQSFKKKDYLMNINIGETHSFAISNTSQLYTWGWNDFGQLGVIEEFTENKQNINQIVIKDLNVVDQTSVGNDFTLVLSNEGKLFGWGKNDKGQLGFFDEDTLTNVDLPMELISIKDEQIKSIKCRMNSAYIVLANGQVYTNKQFSPYTKINFNQKVDRVSCGFNFTIFLTVNGQIYSFGKNQHGQLGLNDMVERKEPTLISFFKSHQINQVECGFAHVVCISNYGRVYVWGWGQNGQLGLGDYSDYLEPQPCKLNNLYKDNIIQVCATRTSTILLINNSEILWFGTNQSIKYVNTPTNFKVSQKLDGMFCMKLNSSWSKTLGVVYGTFAFSKDVSENNMQSTCNTLTKKWIKSNIDTIKPPIVQSIYHKFAQSNMDKSISPKKPKESSGGKQQSPEIIQIEDYSSISHIQEASIHQFDVQDSIHLYVKNQDDQDKKMKEIKHKIEFLKTLPLKQLRQLDKQLLELYQTKQYDKILSNKKFFV